MPVRIVADYSYVCNRQHNQFFNHMAKIVYIIGIVLAVWCVLDIFKKNIGLVGKILLSIAVLAFSWIGFVVYYFFLRNKIN